MPKRSRRSRTRSPISTNTPRPRSNSFGRRDSNREIAILSRRVVITGVGLVCPIGIGTDIVWQNLMAGCSGVGPITQFDSSIFDCHIAAEVRDFDPLLWVSKKDLKKLARFIQFSIAATDFAVRMAG